MNDCGVFLQVLKWWGILSLQSICRANAGQYWVEWREKKMETYAIWICVNGSILSTVPFRIVWHGLWPVTTVPKFYFSRGQCDVWFWPNFSKLKFRWACSSSSSQRLLCYSRPRTMWPVTTHQYWPHQGGPVTRDTTNNLKWYSILNKNFLEAGTDEQVPHLAPEKHHCYGYPLTWSNHATDHIVTNSIIRGRSHKCYKTDNLSI